MKSIEITKDEKKIENTEHIGSFENMVITITSLFESTIWKLNLDELPYLYASEKNVAFY